MRREEKGEREKIRVRWRKKERFERVNDAHMISSSLEAFVTIVFVLASQRFFLSLFFLFFLFSLLFYTENDRCSKKKERKKEKKFRWKESEEIEVDGIFSR